MKRHILKVHEKEKGKKLPKDILKCIECDLSFAMKHKLKEHMKNKHKFAVSVEGREMLQCPECDFQNISKSRIKAHITLNHSEATEPLKCMECDYVCKNKRGLSYHQQKVRKDTGNDVVLTHSTEVQATSEAGATRDAATPIVTTGLASQIRQVCQANRQGTQANGQTTQFTGQVNQTSSGQANGGVSLASMFDGINWEEYQTFVNQYVGSVPNITTENSLTFRNL